MPRNNSKSRKAERRESAQDRQAEWDALSPFDKMHRVVKRVGLHNGPNTNEYRKLHAAGLIE